MGTRLCGDDPKPGSGKAVQVDPIKPTLKAPGTKRLKLQYDILPSNFAVKFNLRCYTPAMRRSEKETGKKSKEEKDEKKEEKRREEKRYEGTV
jgi:hypothetical protein